MANPFPPFQELTSQDWQNYQLALSPTALLDPTGSLFEAALASNKDYFADRVRLSIKAKLPGLAPLDALTQLGIERSMPRGLSETDAAYSARLQAAWTTWPFAGTPFGLLSTLYALGYKNARIYTAGGGGPAWGSPQTWSSFSYGAARGRVYRMSADGQSVVVTALPAGSWFIDAQMPSPGISAWAPNTVYAPGGCVMPSAVSWAPVATYAAGACVKPTDSAPQTGLYYQTQTGGTTGLVQPSWPTQPGGQITDSGGVTWTALRRDQWLRTALGGTSGTTQPFWPPRWAGPPWSGFAWGSNYGASVLDNTVTWSGDGADFWSRFDLVFPSQLPSGQLAQPSDEATLITALVRLWRPAAMTNNRITIFTGGLTWGQTSTPVWGAFTFQSGPTWNSFNWNAGSYSTGTFYASAGASQFGGAGLTWGSSTTTNWSGG